MRDIGITLPCTQMSSPRRSFFAAFSALPHLLVTSSPSGRSLAPAPTNMDQGEREGRRYKNTFGILGQTRTPSKLISHPRPPPPCLHSSALHCSRSSLSFKLKTRAPSSLLRAVPKSGQVKVFHSTTRYTRTIVHRHITLRWRS